MLKMRGRVAAAVGVLLVIGAVAAFGPARPAAGFMRASYTGAAPGKVICSLSLKVSFSPHLAPGGGTGVSTSARGTASGCKATTTAVTVRSGKVTGSFAGSPIDCQDGLTGAAATLQVTWKGQVDGALSLDPGAPVYTGTAHFDGTSIAGGSSSGSFAGPAIVSLSHPPAGTVATGCANAKGLAEVSMTGVLSLGTPTSQGNRTVTQPTPSVSAADFPIEPVDHAPVDGDGRVPNPASPSGVPVQAPGSCAVTISSSLGATSASVNAWIAENENALSTDTVLCLSGVFTEPLHVWSKTSVPLLEIAPAPGTTATLDLGTVSSADTDPNQYWSDTGGISIVDSRSVEVYGLTIENYTYDGPGQTPAGIYVSARSDTQSTDQSRVPHLSACFLGGGSCSNIYLIDNTVSGITNTADENHTTKSYCNNANVDAYGIAVIAGSTSTSQRLQHVVVEGNTVTGTRTGQSETVTFNGSLEDFLAADNVVHNADNIGLDTIGWETGGAQASHGYVYDNTVFDVDTESNAAYGKWNATAGVCEPMPENAAGLYDDGASYIWFDANTVWNSDQGINLDVETPKKETDHLLVSDNTVHQDPGTSSVNPSVGAEPPGFAGTSSVAGHDPYALYIDAFGSKASIADVYVHDNTFQNESQHYLVPSYGMPVVDLGGRWSNVDIWHNTIEGMGGSDRYNPLMEVDHWPKNGSLNVIDCNDYASLSSANDSVDGNFATPKASWLTLGDWQVHNRYGWDGSSGVGGFPTICPVSSIP